MSTLLTNDVAPLWAWILVIVFGSLILIVSVFFGFRYLIRKRQKKAGSDIEAGALSTTTPAFKSGMNMLDPSNTLYIGRTGLLLEHNNGVDSTKSLNSFDWVIKSKKGVVSRHTELSPGPSGLVRNNSEAADIGGTYQQVPRLSLGSFDIAESLSNFSGVSDLSSVSRPSTALTAEPLKATAINFSRPHIRSIPPVPKRNRLSVINESTPRNSFINRIVSWASSSQEDDTHKAGVQQSQKGNSFNVGQLEHNKTTSREASTASISPLNEVLLESQHPFEPATPELPTRHPSRTVTPPNETSKPTSSNTGRVPLSIIIPGSKPELKRTDSSATNFSRRETNNNTTRPGSLSVTDTTRRGQVNVLGHSRTNSHNSWFEEEPQATLTGPFDAPVVLTRRSSTPNSSWSADTMDVTVAYHQATASIRSSLSQCGGGARGSTQSRNTMPIRPSITSSDKSHSRSTSSTLNGSIIGYINRVSSEQGFYQDRNANKNRHQPRNRSWSHNRSSSSVSSTSKNGRQVLRKKSLQTSAN